MYWDIEIDIARTLNILGTGILAGAFLMGTLAVRPAAAALEASPHVLLRQAIIQRLSRLMPPLMLLPLAASSVMLAFHGGLEKWSFETIGWAASVSTFGITVLVNVPLNRRFMQWSSRTLPPDWQTYVRKWNRSDSIRLILALVAAACAVLAGR